jgi:hypothetical protein
MDQGYPSTRDRENTKRMRLLGTHIYIFDASRYLCPLILKMRRKKPREEQFTILVKTELLCTVSYPYEYGAGACFLVATRQGVANGNVEQNSMVAKP